MCFYFGFFFFFFFCLFFIYFADKIAPIFFSKGNKSGKGHNPFEKKYVSVTFHEESILEISKQ